MTASIRQTASLGKQLLNLPAVRRLVRDQLGCGCPEEVFDQVALGVPTLFEGAPCLPLAELVVGRRLMITLVAAEELRNLESDASALLDYGRKTRDAQGLNRFRLVLVGAVPDAALELLRREAASQDEKLHVHQLDPGSL